MKALALNATIRLLTALIAKTLKFQHLSLVTSQNSSANLCWTNSLSFSLRYKIYSRKNHVWAFWGPMQIRVCKNWESRFFFRCCASTSLQSAGRRRGVSKGRRVSKGVMENRMALNSLTFLPRNAVLRELKVLLLLLLLWVLVVALVRR